MATPEQRYGQGEEIRETGNNLFHVCEIRIGPNGRIFSGQSLDGIRRGKPKDTGHRRNPKQGKR
jgi:hypothetical protein